MRKHIRIILLVITIITCTPVLRAQNSESKSEAHKQLVEDFFKRVGGGHGDQAVTEFFRTNPWQFQKKGFVDDFKSKFASLPDMVGGYLAYHIVKSRLITDRLAYIQVVASFERQPVLFSFTVHRPGEKWQAISVNVNFNTDEFVPDLAK